ncbi:four helix bundle protein [Pollutibacter soli]|uniref:four helix bundle protein n=1 Tax=Pollutibacter soli TaxID=3034157 RepID=UPI003013F3AE
MTGFMYKKLIVWQKSIDLTGKLYELTNLFPKSEEYVLKSQMRRAVISISSNIAEGSARKTKNDQQRFYTIARSSLIELDSQLEMALALNFIKTSDIEKVDTVMTEIYKMISKLIAD